MLKYYLAYGSNLNLEQMEWRCPGAELIGTGDLPDYKMTFRSHNRRGGVANIEPCKGAKVKFGLFTIGRIDEAALDRYEGYPWLYKKQFIPVEVDGKLYLAMVYVMCDGYQLAEPNQTYIDIIEQGYRDCGFDVHEFNDWVVANRQAMQNE